MEVAVGSRTVREVKPWLHLSLGGRKTGWNRDQGSGWGSQCPFLPASLRALEVLLSSAAHVPHTSFSQAALTPHGFCTFVSAFRISEDCGLSVLAWQIKMLNKCALNK